ncbi:MAG: hypothetical protein D6806_14210 [Deltaproteobacteria bacterium]|nr:MAG: hypothetical protein D6806_14210 [Deltaproteobacteria bacterium]
MIHYPYPIAIITPALHDLVSGSWLHELLASWSVPVRPWVDYHVVGMWLIYLSLFFSLFSAVQYMSRFIREMVRREREAGSGAT